MSDWQEPEKAEAKASRDKLVLELGQKIASIRAEKKMTQTEVADRMKLVRAGNLVSQYERGKLEMGVSIFLDFAQALGVTPNELIPDDNSIETALAKERSANNYDKLTNKNKQVIDYMIQALISQQILESRAAV